jgi:hypothetical protein
MRCLKMFNIVFVQVRGVRIKTIFNYIYIYSRIYWVCISQLHYLTIPWTWYVWDVWDVANG